MASSLPISRVAVGRERKKNKDTEFLTQTPRYTASPNPHMECRPRGPGSPASTQRCDHEPESLNCFKRRGGPKTQRGISLDDLWEMNEGGGRQRRERV